MDIKQSIKNFLHKIPAFFSGLMLGIILTGSFFLFKINEYLLQIKKTLYPKITVVEEKQKNSQTDTKTKKHSKNYEQKNNTIQMPTADSSVAESNNPTILEEKNISEKKIQIIRLNTPSDTTLAKTSEIPTSFRESEIKIIFRKTPFNNKGYYFDDNYLVLYGLEDIPYINVYEYNNELYIKYDKVVFQLPFT
ncbi:MAG: hypothetical protein N3E37_05615, partial [Candidatus Micrarchaeota archaeon]|nr:hypothetical protein [Candidatus Micrarchaeota archaeon]